MLDAPPRPLIFRLYETKPSTNTRTSTASRQILHTQSQPSSGTIGELAAGRSPAEAPRIKEQLGGAAAHQPSPGAVPGVPSGPQSAAGRTRQARVRGEPRRPRVREGRGGARQARPAGPLGRELGQGGPGRKREVRGRGADDDERHRCSHSPAAASPTPGPGLRACPAAAPAAPASRG